MAGSQKITNLTDLAALAGVSVGTSSKAISGTGTLSPATRQRIRDLAEIHGYEPNRTAQNLKSGRTKAISVVIPLWHDAARTISDPFFITLIGYIADELSSRGTDLLLTKLVPDAPHWLGRMVRSGRADGVIVIGESNQVAELEAVARVYRPLIVWGQRDPAVDRYLTVGTDNHRGGYLATRHLLERGRNRIAFVGMTELPEIAARRDGYLQALREASLSPRTQVDAPLTAEDAYRITCAALDNGLSCDAMVTASDVIAMSVMRALSERGHSVPGDVAVTGYDDISLASYTTPPLTTIRQDLAGAARQLVDGVFRRIEGEDFGSVVLPPELIVRGST